MKDLLIVNARILPMDGEIIENGYIFTLDNKIIQLGKGMPSITDTEIIDAKGGWVLPGFIDAHTHLGMWEDGLGFEGDDGNEDTDPATPHLRAIDAVNPLDRSFTEALEAGVTTVLTGPGSANVIGGQIAAMKTYGRRIEDMIVKEPAAIKFSLGENPKTVYHGKNLAPVTRMATAAIIREQLLKAKRYIADLDNAQNDEDVDEPEFDIKCEALIPLLKKQISAHIHAHRADDIFTALRLSKEFDIDCIIIHCTDGHLIADILAQEGIKVFSGPHICDRSKPELKNLDPKSPAILSKAGVMTAITTDHPVTPIQYLPLCAAIAVREGMEYMEALKAITINPAKICGLDSRVGSLTPNKDADIVIFDGDPLQITAKPRMVIVGGKVVFGKM
jgi:imidazolonepropionase-like amidohydrolase